MQRAILAGFVVVSSSLSAANEQFPYTAYVVNSSSSVLGGPDSQFYATDRLRRGDRVEVYRHDGAFAAIRPPSGSFSWVSAESVETTEMPDFLQVSQSNVFSRVGSRFGSKHSAEYMPLEFGELVEVLGQQSLRDPAGEQLWYKIAPVTGEFRWIRLSALSRLPPSDEDREPVAARSSGLAAAPAEPHDLAGPPEPRRLFELTQPDGSEPGLADEERANSQGEQPTGYDNRLDELAQPAVETELSESRGQITTITRIGAQPQVRTEPPVDDRRRDPPLQDDNVQPVQWHYDMSPRTQTDIVARNRTAAQRSTWREVSQFGAPRIASLPSASPITRPGSPSIVQDILPLPLPVPSNASIATAQIPDRRNLPPVSRDFLRQELTEIDVQLANIVIDSPETWSLMPLQVQTQAVIDASHDPDLRDEAQSILAKISQFQDVQRRHRQMNRDPSVGFDQGNLRELVAAASTTDSALTSTSLNYDGTGWLMPVMGNRKGMPRYVLTDEHGQVRQFVTPQPGLNLRQFVKQKIGVYGQKTYLPAFNQPHLMAERIISLDMVGRR